MRGRMAERGLKQHQVAEAIGVERSNLTRRLQGRTMEQPTERMVAQLASLLQLDRDGEQYLFALAGYGEEASSPRPSTARTGVEPIAVEAGKARMRAQPVSRRRLLGGVAVGVAVLALAGIVSRLIAIALPLPQNRRTVRAPTGQVDASVRPGGLWLRPANGDTISGQIHFAARAYPTNAGDPAIAFVNFTVSWEGRAGPWLIACRVAQPASADVYECDWDPAAAGVPAGALHLSFDVYDTAAQPHINFAPNGTHTVRYAPAARSSPRPNVLSSLPR